MLNKLIRLILTRLSYGDYIVLIWSWVGYEHIFGPDEIR